MNPAPSKHHLRFHSHSGHLAPAFGSDAFGLRAEAFARFFGTPAFLIGQTVLVGTWILLNAIGVVRFDLYPFILLNLAFSLQAAYAAPLILLAQTRQADRDKAGAENDAMHREEIARISSERQLESARQLDLLLELMRRNTELTDLTHQMSRRIESLTSEIHSHIQSHRA
ncbi:DUF1003 domain-containing protein [Luteolibacter marinus]|uniref:DUF1003 domain-containing protein n=1 Tax=Luteolibacter marinus TaxID=2776705 RepID=UPI001865C88A|nr:DUF1003 domain-containing protein [Luteolibacter marinus]